jgi:hypothetical protein
MGDLLGSLIWGAKSGQYCVIGGGSLQDVYLTLNSLTAFLDFGFDHCGI